MRATETRIESQATEDGVRETVLTFSLSHASVVRFRVRREAPTCAVVGTFSVRGHAGRNRVRFRGRLGGEILPPGTYTITASTRRGTRIVSLGRMTVVIAPPGVAEESARRQRSVCPAPGHGTGDSGSGALETGGAGGDADAGAAGRARSDVTGVAAGASASATASAVGGDPRGAHDGQLLGVVRNPFEDAPAWLQPVLMLVLAAAIVLLLLAAAPAALLHPTGAATGVHRRAELALAGAMILAAVAVAALAL